MVPLLRLLALHRLPREVHRHRSVHTEAENAHRQRILASIQVVEAMLLVFLSLGKEVRTVPQRAVASTKEPVPIEDLSARRALALDLPLVAYRTRFLELVDEIEARVVAAARVTGIVELLNP